MKLGWQPSIARRLVLALLTASAMVWLSFYVQGLYSVYKEGSGSFDSELLGLAEAIIEVIDETPTDRATEVAVTQIAGQYVDTPLIHALRGVRSTINAEVKFLGSPPGFMAFQVRKADGSLVSSGGDGPASIPADLPTGYSDATLGMQKYRVYRRWSADKAFRIDVVQSRASQQQIFDRVMISREGLVHPFLIGFPLLLLPVWLAVHTGLAPLRRLSGELARRNPSDLQAIQEPHVYSELAPLVRELNAAMDRLRTLLQRERNFLSDAAHELRTPLAVISAQCDTLLQSQTPQEKEDAAKRLQGGVDRSMRLVNQLLSLARLDADVEDKAVEFDLANLVRDCLANHARSARGRSIDLSYVGPNQCVLLGPQMALESVLNNLVGNAICYGNRGGQVEVHLSLDEKRNVHLQVADDGPGIEPDHHEHLFERFRRGRNPNASGSGLGLAIVASAARQMGARIEVSEGLLGKGLEVKLIWPVHFSEDVLNSDAS